MAEGKIVWSYEFQRNCEFPLNYWQVVSEFFFYSHSKEWNSLIQETICDRLWNISFIAKNYGNNLN